MHVAFSTLACPDFTLDHVARHAGSLGYDGVELRTFGFGNPAGSMVCDPALTDPIKVNRVLAEHGVRPLGIATSLKFDRIVFPPIIGRAITDQEREARQAKRLIDLAAKMDCPAIRVFAFETQGRESRAAAVRRIAWRLGMAVDAARNTGVRVLLENGGSFGTSGQLQQITDQIASAALGVCYNVAAARHAGEDPLVGLDALGDRLAMVRVKGHRAGTPCLLADADDPNADVVRALAARRFTGTLVYEYDLHWQDVPARAQLPTGEQALAHAIETIYAWMARGRTRPAGPAQTPARATIPA